jgi:hypothetical protein
MRISSFPLPSILLIIKVDSFPPHIDAASVIKQLDTLLPSSIVNNQTA